MQRAVWHRRTTLLPLAWLAIAAVVALAKIETDHHGWLLIHTLLFGAVSNAILIWTRHFTLVLLFLPERNQHGQETLRIALLNIGILAVLLAELLELHVLLALGAVVSTAVIAWHAQLIYVGLRRALPTRFRFTVQAYAIAALMLIIGIIIGYWLGTHELSDEVESSLTMAHVTLNVLGWIGITIFATIVTLGPTMLRVQMVASTDRKARQALPFFVCGVVIAAGGFAIDIRALALLGVVVYLIGTGLTLMPLIGAVQRRGPSSFASWATLVGFIWLVLSIAGFGLLSMTSDDLPDSLAELTAPAMLGGIVQIVLGSLSYLLPAMSGGGPAAVRHRNEIADRFKWFRLIALNTSVVLILFPSTLPGYSLAAIAVALTAILIVLSTRNELVRSNRPNESS